jgi:hypothetical protein
MAKSKREQVEGYATAVGFALHAWSLVEYGLAQLFEEWSGIQPPRKADAAFLAIKSFEVRLDVCHRLMLFAELSEMHSLVWKLLYAEMKRLYGKRHRLAHFTFVDSTTVSKGKSSKKTVLVPFYPSGRVADGWTVEDIDARAAEFSELAWAVKWFWELSMSARCGQSPPPAAGLVRQLHLKAAQTLAKSPRRPQSPRA